MLEIQKFLKGLGKDKRSIAHHILRDRLGIKIKKCPLYTYSRRVLDYLWLYESTDYTKIHPITSECSSLVLDSNFDIVSKFPNRVPFITEPNAPELVWSEVTGRVTYHGYTISIYKHKNQLCFHTYNDINGNVHTENKSFQLKLIRDIATDILVHNLGPEIIYAFSSEQCVICKLVRRELPDLSSNYFFLQIINVIDRNTGIALDKATVNETAINLNMKASMPIKVRSMVDAIYLTNNSSNDANQIKGMILEDGLGNAVKMDNSQDYDPRIIYNESTGLPFRGLADIVLHKNIHDYLYNAPEYKDILNFMRKELGEMLLEASILWEELADLPSEARTIQLDKHPLKFLFDKRELNLFQDFFIGGKKRLDVDIFLKALWSRSSAGFCEELKKLAEVLHAQNDIS